MINLKLIALWFLNAYSALCIGVCVYGITTMLFLLVRGG